MTLTTTEKRSILAGHHPALSRETQTFKKGEVISLRSLRSLQGPVPAVSITITNVKKKNGNYLPEYTVRDDRALYLQRGAGYTRSVDKALDLEAPILDPEVLEEYAMEGVQKATLMSAEQRQRQKAESNGAEHKAGRGKQAREYAARAKRLEA
jgi:hypothetical protein